MTEGELIAMYVTNCSGTMLTQPLSSQQDCIHARRMCLATG